MYDLLSLTEAAKVIGVHPARLLVDVEDGAYIVFYREHRAFLAYDGKDLLRA